MTLVDLYGKLWKRFSWLCTLLIISAIILWLVFSPNSDIELFVLRSNHSNNRSWLWSHVDPVLEQYLISILSDDPMTKGRHTSTEYRVFLSNEQRQSWEINTPPGVIGTQSCLLNLPTGSNFAICKRSIKDVHSLQLQRQTSHFREGLFRSALKWLRIFHPPPLMSLHSMLQAVRSPFTVSGNK